MDESFCTVQDFENYALQVLPKGLADFYANGSYEEYSLRNNRKAFSKLRIKPKFLRDVKNRNMATKVLDFEIKAPIGIAPTAFQKAAHPDGECATAKAAGSLGTIYILSTVSTTSIEDVAAASPGTIIWFQLYFCEDRKLTESLIRRAEKANFKAIVLTVDANTISHRHAEKRNNFKLPSHLRLANLPPDVIYPQYVKEGLTWDDLYWLKSITKLPIILKGILTADDAIKAAEIGIRAIIVSNHGGRQLDFSPATIEVLPEISRAVGDKMELYLDGGIRVGSDIFKAIALGAKMVFVGRPILWGLTHSGEKGVKKILDILVDEFDRTMGLSGCCTLSDIKKEMVVHQSYYNKL